VPILPNAKHELFAQSLAQGKSAAEAYETAGYRASRKNAWRLKTNKDINARVVELQCNAARSTEVSIQSILRELDDAIAVARERGQAQPMVSAAAMKAKLTGLMVERQQVSVTQEPSNFDQAETAAEVLSEVAEKLGLEVAAILAALFDIEFTELSLEEVIARHRANRLSGTASVDRKMLDRKPPKPDSKREI
jgi:hypothetical protein